MQAERTNSYNYYQTQFSLIKSKTLALLVLEELKIKNNKETKKPQSKRDGKLSELVKSFKSLISKGKSSSSVPRKGNKLRPKTKISDSEAYSFISGLSVGSIGNTRLARVSYVSSDPVYASLAADTIVDVYIDWILQRRLGTSKSAREFLKNQLDQLKAKIEQTEEDLSTFARNVDIISLDKDIDLNYKQLVEITDALSKLETEKFKKQVIINEVKAGNYAYLPEVISNPRVQELSSSYSALRAEYDNLSAIYGPNFPDIQKVRSQMNSVQGQP